MREGGVFVEFEVVVLINGENKDWFIKSGLMNGFTVRIGDGYTATICLELAYSKGKQKVFRIPTVLKDKVEPRINVWETGSGGNVTVIAGINGEKLNPISLRMRSGMALFSMQEGCEFISVTVVKKNRINRVAIEKHYFLKQVDPDNLEKSILVYFKNNIFLGKWTSKMWKHYPKYQDAVEAAIKRSDWNGDSFSSNPFYVK